MSTEKVRDPSHAERGLPPSKFRKSDFFNYHPPFSVLLLEFLVWLFLFFVCFLEPNGGLAAVIRSDDEYIGLLKKCSASSCDGWMQGATSSSSDSSSSSSDALRRSLTPRAIDSSIDLANFYLTTGLAALCSFWLMTYTFLFTFYRFSTSPPPPPPTQGEEGQEEPKTRWGRMKRGWKRFVFRVSRLYVFFLGWIVLGVACAASWQVQKASGDGGSVGLALIFLHASWILLFICAFLEISRGSLRRRADLGWLGCLCLPFFSRCKTRATKKWERAEGGEADDDAQEGRTKKRKEDREGRSRSRTRTGRKRRERDV
ncbi:hypothetical protein L198_05638 [Cryptococcus wingfieldii CBS 7118]|uniref:Transmembrane protein n=1 Tax=Cryptococcus wingfieldii CBS 7118 TaxID=1295528 RepID=A0A1E3IYQ7_9TREE|nr:hypothetical protein L198_05638 [Cryptococcus wingfieldii CBS 7118]ODN92841.1 hypothetical protein L198_05638 [Cryptococcus wingfieldii CBS 7118]